MEPEHATGRPPGYATDSRPRRILTAEIVAVGTELTVGETRDTNAGDLAASLTRLGITVGRLVAVPDRLEVVVEVLRAGLERADLLVTTGGLGPTPDDLTREGIAAVLGETPTVDPDLAAWLRELFGRRGLPFPEANLKQAWLIPSATAIPNDRGTAPGWWIDAPGGQVIVALPGPPREMRSQWEGWVVPRLTERGAGADTAARTYRLAGIGESHVADRLGESLLRGTNPVVATYARADAVDVRISATALPGSAGGPGTSAADLLAGAERAVLSAVGDHVWGEGTDTWAEVLGRRAAERAWSIAIHETGTAGTLRRLLGDAPWLRVPGDDEAAAGSEGSLDDRAAGSRGDLPPNAGFVDPGELLADARTARDRAGATAGLAVVAGPRDGDTSVDVAVVTPEAELVEHRLAFLGGSAGRSRAALLAASILLLALGGPDAALADRVDAAAGRRFGEHDVAHRHEQGRGGSTDGSQSPEGSTR